MENNFLETKLSKQYRNIPVSFVRSILNVANQSDVISFAGGLPNPSLFPVKEIEKSAQAVMAKYGESILQYAGSMGYLPLREWIAARYTDKYGMDITADMVVITNGSQQAIDIMGKLFVNKRDDVVIERPSYLGAIQALSAYLANFVEIDLDDDGANLNQLEELYLSSSVKMMYAVPNAQNPSGISYSEEKRKSLALLLKKYNQFLLEDDPYNEIYFETQFPAPVRKYAPDNVAWTGSFSKMVAPGLRNGWVILPPDLVPHFDKAKQSTDLNPNNLTQYVLYHYLMNNDLEEHLAKVRKKYWENCQFMSDMISTYLPDEVRATKPSGGMFIWLSLPEGVNSDDLVKRTMKRGVIFVPGKSFYTKGQGSDTVRMNFSNADFPEIEKGIKIMGEEIVKMMKKEVVPL